MASLVTLYAPASAAEPSLPVQRTSDFATSRARELKPTRLVTYKTVDDRALELHVFEPAGHQPTDRRPCFLVIHGGGWVAGTPTVMYPVAEYFAQRGWLVVSLRYRLHKPDAGTTAWDSVRDARSAVRYLRQHATDLGIDANRIVAGGRSAGGHLAVATALCDGLDEPGEDSRVSCVPNALVLYSPVIDTSEQGYGHELLGERWRELSPVHRVRSALPPTIVFHGRRDTTTPFAGAEAFHRAMLAAGNRCELVAHDRGSHSYMIAHGRVVRRSDAAHRRLSRRSRHHGARRQLRRTVAKTVATPRAASVTMRRGLRAPTTAVELNRCDKSWKWRIR